MASNKRIIATMVVVVLMAVSTALPTSAASNTGTASIGFSGSDIVYVPMGISGIQGALGYSFGTHTISTSGTETYPALNTAGYVVRNNSGGTAGYRVTLGLSSFDRGLEGAYITMRTDNRGVVSDRANATNPPILFGGQQSVRLEADGQSQVPILQGTSYAQNPGNVAMGLWGANFEADLTVYTHTILAGQSRAVMTWELAIV